jgi:CHAD domain-containing protein
MKELRYRVPLGVDASTIADEFTPANVLDDGERRVQRTFLDSFDWRVHNAGGLVERERSGRASRLIWRNPTGTFSLDGIAARRVRFAHDLPESALRRGLAPILDARALLPVATVTGRERTLRALDGERKTVARVMIEELAARPPDRGTKRRFPPAMVELGTFIAVRPLRGYESEAKKIARRLAKAFRLESVTDDLLETAVRAVGRRVGDYTSKLQNRFDPGEPAEPATRRVLLNLLDAMERNVPGLRDDLDPEFLHDFRVAGRRTRSALGSLRLFDAEAIRPFRKGFAWLGRISGELRDLDVWLLEFETYRARLPQDIQDDLDPFRTFLRGEQARAHRALVRKLDSDRYVALVQNWRTFLRTAPIADAAAGKRPLLDVASREIKRAHKRLVRDGDAIRPETGAAALHDLRKTAKRLRYLMEFFRSVYPPKRIGEAVRTLRVLQDNLGQFQDLEVQRDSLRGFGERMAEAGVAPTSTLLAMGILVEDLSRRQQGARDEFAKCYAQMAASKSRKLFERLFYAKAGARSGKRKVKS